ncbi:MAG: glycoside hydrolase family 9 protein [FCB group bacterium]|nr:glycoside hydrolase family 9 protein [FCB group bacterium]
MLAGLMVAACVLVGGAEPEVKWVYEAQSQLYAAPLVADLHPAPGLEVVISDSDARKLRCIGADGKQLWEYDGGWKKRLTSGAAWNFRTGPEARLAVGNGDGSEDCIDGESGERLWKAHVGKVEWSNVVWTARQTLVVASEETGLTALDANGIVLWKYACSVSTPIVVQNVDGDANHAIFACTKWGPLCVDSTGALRWKAATGDDFSFGSVAVGKSKNGEWMVYSTSQDSAALHCFDAKTGERRWVAPMVAPCDIYSASSVALGNLDADGAPDVVLADRVGHIYCFDATSGELHWMYATDVQTHAAVSLADVDCDGRMEALVASGDHGLYCLSFDGALKWRHATDLRIVGPARTADLDRDGTLDVLVCGSDRKLRCLTLGGRWRNAAVASESYQEVTETRALFSEGGFEQSSMTGKSEDYPQEPPVGVWLANRPKGWRLVQGPPQAAAANAAWGRDAANKRTGETSMRLGPAPAGFGKPLAAATDDLEVVQGMKSVNASAWSKGGGGCARLEWSGLHGQRETSTLAPGQTSPEGWTEHRIEGAIPPFWARWVRLRLEVNPAATVYWDEAQIEGAFQEPRRVTVLLNQAGYDLGMPKHFVVESNFVPDKDEIVTSGSDLVLAQIRCIVQKPDGEWVSNASLEYKGRIQGAYGKDWGSHYWRGDFSSLNEPGHYRMEVWLGAWRTYSAAFEIGEDLLWKKTARAAYRFFYYQRCGVEIPGLHKACHLDDSTDPEHTQQWDLTGGWHDAGDYNKYHNAPYVLGLAWSYEREQELFDADDQDGNGRGDFLDEILWGADHAVKMIAPDGSAFGPITSGYGFWGPPEIETDNKPLTGDERPTPGPGSDPGVHAAAVAKAAKFTKEAKYIEAAARALQYGLDRNQRGSLQFSASIDLYLATDDEKFAKLAKEMAPSIAGGEVDALELYDRTFGEDHGTIITAALKAEADALLANARNPFGVWTFGPPEKPNFFGTPEKGDGWHVGNSARMFEAANRMAMAYRRIPDERYLEYIYDQFNWMLGGNPYGISLMEGVGKTFAPSYHQRLTFAGVARGAVPGSVVNGITYRAPGDDRPYFDMRGIDIPSFESNEVWLPHNTAYLQALSNLPGLR